MVVAEPFVQPVGAQLAFADLGKSSGVCRRCGRTLSDPVSVALGIGPVCRGHTGAGADTGRETTDRHDLEFDPVTGNIVCRRNGDGTLSFNLAPRYVHHSPTGWEWGYGGSGPADFALNIVAWFVDAGALFGDHFEPVKLWSGQAVPSIVWSLHQDFKWAFVANLPREGGVIAGAEIRRWLAEHGVPADAIR